MFVIPFLCKLLSIKTDFACKCSSTLGFCFYVECNAMDVLWIMMCCLGVATWSPIWCDRVERPVESVPRNASQTRLGYRGSASVPTVRTFRPHLRETENSKYDDPIMFTMNVVVLTPTDNPIARARIRRRMGGPARRATRSLVCGKNFEPCLLCHHRTSW